MKPIKLTILRSKITQWLKLGSFWNFLLPKKVQITITENDLREDLTSTLGVAGVEALIAVIKQYGG